MLGLRFCARALSSCGKWGPLFIAVRRPLTIAASLVAEHRLQRRRLSSCGSRAQLLRGLWDPPRPGLEPVYPALAGRFSTAAPPGKPLFCFILKEVPFSGLLGPSGEHHFGSKITDSLHTLVGLLSRMESHTSHEALCVCRVSGNTLYFTSGGLHFQSTRTASEPHF